MVVSGLLANVTFQTLLEMVRLCTPSAAEGDLHHIPDSLQDIPDVQDFEECAGDTATSRQRTHQIQIRLGGEGPQKHKRYQEHLTACHEGWGADREVQDRNVDRAVEDAKGSDAGEDGRLRQCDTYYPLERYHFTTGLGTFEVGGHASSKGYDARDADGGRYGLHNFDRHRSRRQLVFEWTHRFGEDPMNEAGSQLHCKNLEYQDPYDLVSSASIVLHDAWLWATNVEPSETASIVLRHAALAAIAMETREIAEVVLSRRILRCDVDDNEVEHCDKREGLVKLRKGQQDP